METSVVVKKETGEYTTAWVKSLNGKKALACAIGCKPSHIESWYTDPLTNCTRVTFTYGSSYVFTKSAMVEKFLKAKHQAMLKGLPTPYTDPCEGLVAACSKQLDPPWPWLSDFKADYESMMESECAEIAKEQPSPDYAFVARKLGFTEWEVQVLVRANDRGLSFEQIAALIESHPPIYGEQMSAQRKIDEGEFIARVQSAVGPKSAPAKKYYSHTLTMKYLDDSCAKAHEPEAGPHLVFFEGTEQGSKTLKLAYSSQIEKIAAELMSAPLAPYSIVESKTVLVHYLELGDVAKACGFWLPEKKW